MNKICIHRKEIWLWLLNQVIATNITVLVTFCLLGYHPTYSQTRVEISFGTQFLVFQFIVTWLQGRAASQCGMEEKKELMAWSPETEREREFRGGWRKIDPSRPCPQWPAFSNQASLLNKTFSCKFTGGQIYWWASHTYDPVISQSPVYELTKLWGNVYK